MIMGSYIEEGYIHIPIYYTKEKRKIVVDIDSIREEFNEKLGIVVSNPKKYVEE